MAAERQISFPADSGVKYAIRDFGCVADGKTDTTARLQFAIASVTNHQYGNKRLYLENGTYLVRDALFEKDLDGDFQGRLVIVGQSRSGVVIKLGPSSKGFNDTGNPKAVLTYASYAGLPEQPTTGAGGSGFVNHLQNLTIEIGSGNPGAVAVDWIANNDGLISDVTLKGTASGWCGLRGERKFSGPCLVKNLRIEGFDYGIRTDQFEYNLSIKNLEILNQRVEGITNQRLCLHIDGLHSTNSVPAIHNTGADTIPTLFLLNANLEGGTGGTYAIVNDGIDATQKGCYYLRDVTSKGYAGVIVDSPGVASISQLTSHAVTSQFTSTGLSLRLPRGIVPDEPNYPVSRWINVRSQGAFPDTITDDTAAIQRAMNFGAPVVYASPTKDDLTQFYDVTSTITIPAGVEIVDFLHQYVRCGAAFPGTSTPVFKITGNTSKPLFLKNFAFTSVDTSKLCTFFQHESNRPVIIQNFLHMQIYKSLAGAGSFYMENAALHLILAAGQNVWGWQVNPEGDFLTTKIDNSGNLWICGMKTERQAVNVTGRAGSKTEILGADFHPAEAVDATMPVAVFEEGAKNFIAYRTTSNSLPNSYTIHVRETHGGVTKDQPAASVVRPSDPFAWFNCYSGAS